MNFEEILASALALELPYSERFFIPGRAAAVLALFGSDRAGGVSILLTRRAETLEHHKGQMAFPGGTVEQGEDDAVAALRETDEELGIPPERVRVVGRLPQLSTPTGFQITPVVGLLEGHREDLELRPNRAEIAKVDWIPLSVLLDEGIYQSEFINAGPVRYLIHVYQVGDCRIWGATGAMLKNLLDRLKRSMRAKQEKEMNR